MIIPKIIQPDWDHNLEVYHITQNGVITVIDRTAFLEWVHISVSVTGSGAKIGIRNKETPPKYVIPLTVLADPGADVAGQLFNPNPPRLFWMEGGIEIESTGNTPGVTDVWITFWKTHA